MSLQSPVSPSFQAESKVEIASKDLNSKLVSSTSATGDLLTPPPTNSSSPLNSKEILLPNNFKYYTKHLNKNQFNSILINCTVNLMKILYKDYEEETTSEARESIIDEKELKFFMVEILRRSKTSIQSLQLTCFYLVKLIKLGVEDLKSDPLFKDAKKLFLGLIIIASKFNQDYNYSFKSWLKICGVKEDEHNGTFNLKILKSIEFKCLTLLNYDIYLNDLKYENWCNILIIFGYDFIKCQLVQNSYQNNEIFWECNQSKVAKKLVKWANFFTHNFKLNNLNLIKINFNNYYLNQLGTKILIKDGSIPSLFAGSAKPATSAAAASVSRKRSHDQDYIDGPEPAFGFTSSKKVRA